MKFDPTKPVMARDGRKARIICTDARNPFPLVALLERPDGTEEVLNFISEGAFHPTGESGIDLVNIPETRTEKVKLIRFRDGTPTVAVDAHDAPYAQSRIFGIAEVEVTFTEGRGL